jgi:hypothetical protein
VFSTQLSVFIFADRVLRNSLIAACVIVIAQVAALARNARGL